MPKKPLTKRSTRPLHIIAEEILADINSGIWSKHAAFHAAPYLRAMRELSAITDNYLLDSGKSVVRYFLANASTYRGETARRIKAELRGMLA